jgi:hypothetical protein
VFEGCGICGGDSSTCDDCLGIMGGTVVEDECGICGGDGSTCDDCAGVPNGDNVQDQCGVCDNDPSNDCVQDCMGLWGGSADIIDYYYDFDDDGEGAGTAFPICGSNVPTNMVSNSNDGNDNCYSNILDECGVCLGDNTSCTDCALVPNGTSYKDECDICDDDTSNDCVQDCTGLWGGSAEILDYYYDFDLDGLGAGTAYSICNAYPPSTMVANSNDEDDDCYSNVLDECGVCDGDNSSCEIPGCMDETAYNYNPNAIIDNGSCLYTVYLSFGDINITGYDSTGYWDDDTTGYWDDDSTGYGGYDYCDGIDNDDDGFIDEDGECDDECGWCESDNLEIEYNNQEDCENDGFYWNDDDCGGDYFDYECFEDCPPADDFINSHIFSKVPPFMKSSAGGQSSKHS